METWDIWNVQISENENKKAARVQLEWSKVKIILHVLMVEAFESHYNSLYHMLR